MTTYNIYCDESCHLEHDGLKVMVLGGVWCPRNKTREIFGRLREIKLAHGLPPSFEMKWTKVSPGLVKFYIAVIDYFFDDDDLRFRTLIVPDKGQLQHDLLRQTHDEFYYKMYFYLLNFLLRPTDCYRIFLDYKDTRGAERVRKLKDILHTDQWDFDKKIIERVDLVKSHQVALVQLADLLIGAIAYANRGLESSPAKLELVRRVRMRSGYQLTKSTLMREEKFNVFKWTPKKMKAIGGASMAADGDE